MEYVAADCSMADDIYHVLHTTIKTVYPKYYPKEVVDFFCRLHSREHILEGIASGNMGVWKDGHTVLNGQNIANEITNIFCLLTCGAASGIIRLCNRE